MKRFILLLFAVTIVFSGYSQTKPPKKIRKAFEEKYVGAQDLEWSKTGDRSKDIKYRAEYKLDGREMASTYDYYGAWIITVIFIEIDELPKAVQTAISDEYMNAKIVKAGRLEEPELSSYGVALDYLDSRMIIQLREDGRVLRRRLESIGFEL